MSGNLSLKLMDMWPNRLSLHTGLEFRESPTRVMIMGIREEIVTSTGLKEATFDPSLEDRTYASQLRNNGGFFPNRMKKIDAPDLIDVLSDLDFIGWTTEEPYYRLDPRRNSRSFCEKAWKPIGMVGKS